MLRDPLTSKSTTSAITVAEADAADEDCDEFEGFCLILT